MKYIIIIIGIILLVINSVWNIVQPEVSTEIAMRQFEDPSVVTDTVQRLNVWPSIWFGYLVLIIFGIFRGFKK